MSGENLSILNITPTICELMGINKPNQAKETIIKQVSNYFLENLKGKKIEKCLVFAPDAVGEIAFEKQKALFEEILAQNFLKINLQSVYKPITPVCFGSMFTGASPEIHGIVKYEKPVIKIETIFDSLIKEKKHPAIVAVKNSSIDLIFRNREMEYYSEFYDNEVVDKTISLLKENNNDFILSYNQEYDDCIHETIPFSEEAIKALKNQNSNFIKLFKAFNQYWSGYNRLIVYTPDHGCHIDEKTGKGDHGDNIPEDMNLIHFWGIYIGDK